MHFMPNLIACFKNSAKDSKNLRAMVLTALFIGLNLILDRFSIQLTPEIRLGLGFLTSAMIGMLFGPVMGISAGFVTEILSYILYPRGAYFPGLTLTAMLGGMVYGLVLYQHKVSIPRCLVAKGIVNLFLNIGLNTLWLSMIYGDAYFAILPARMLKNAVLWPVESLALFLVAKAVAEVARRASIRRSA